MAPTFYDWHDPVDPMFASIAAVADHEADDVLIDDFLNSPEFQLAYEDGLVSDIPEHVLHELPAGLLLDPDPMPCIDDPFTIVELAEIAA